MLNKKWSQGANWNRWVATNIHLDQSFPLRNKWSPLRWFGPGWATFLGVGVALPWKPDKAESTDGECPWPVCLRYDQWMLVPCSQGWAILMLIVLWSLRCPIMVENMAEGGPHWILDAYQGRVECWAQKIATHNLGDSVRTIMKWSKLLMGPGETLLLQM